MCGTWPQDETRLDDAYKSLLAVVQLTPDLMKCCCTATGYARTRRLQTVLLVIHIRCQWDCAADLATTVLRATHWQLTSCHLTWCRLLASHTFRTAALCPAH
jgi:hypothetical protein